MHTAQGHATQEEAAKKLVLSAADAWRRRSSLNAVPCTARPYTEYCDNQTRWRGERAADACEKLEDKMRHGACGTLRRRRGARKRLRGWGGAAPVRCGRTAVTGAARRGPGRGWGADAVRGKEPALHDF